MKKTFFIGCAVILMAMTLIPGVQAVGILPFIVGDVDLNPGEIATRTVTVFNSTETEQTYYLLAKNFTTQGEEGKVVISEEDYGLATWIDFPFTSVTLSPGESKDVEFRIMPPSNADAGGHYAAVFASTSPPDVERGVGLSGNVGSLVFVRIEGDIIEDVRMLSFHVKEDQKFFNRLPVEFEYRLENRGTVHAKPDGKVIISGLFGKTEIAANPNENRILPSSIRRIETAWTKADKTYEKAGFFEELSNEWHNFGFGKYTAKLNLNYGKEVKNLQAETSFWVFPWRVCLVGLLIVILAVIGIIYYNKMVVATARRKGKV